jgi:hypothetical protein
VINTSRTGGGRCSIRLLSESSTSGLRIWCTSSRTSTTGIGSSARPDRICRASGAAKVVAGAISRSGLPSGTAADTASAPSTSDQNVRRSLSESSTVSQTAAIADRSNQEATASVLPKPGPALSRVTGRGDPPPSCCSNRVRRTNPGGTVGGDARNRSWPAN